MIKCRPADAGIEILRRLKELGLVRIFLGIESSTDRGLAALERNQSTEDSERSLESCAKLDISAQFTLMIFNPGTTLDSLQSDLAFMRRFCGNPLNFCRAEIYAGTPLEKRMIELGRATGDYLARVYKLADPVADLACDVSLDLFYPRCWANGSLMQIAIGLDHAASVVKRFSNHPHQRALCRQVASWMRAVNLDMIDLLEEVIRLADSARGRVRASLEESILEIRERETRNRQKFLSNALNLRAELQEFRFTNEGIQSSHLSIPSHTFARPVAAALLAIGVSAPPACLNVAAQEVNAPSAVSAVHQDNLCSMEGTVTRMGRDPIYYAMVTIENLDTGQTYMFRTDRAGRYVASDLHGGLVNLRVQAAAHLPFEKNGIVLKPGASEHADFSLTVDCAYIGCTEYAAAPLRPPEDLLTKRKPFGYYVGSRKDGNTFPGIAKVVYDDPNMWLQIYEANKEKIKKLGFIQS